MAIPDSPLALNLATFTDMGSISSFALDSVSQMQATGVISGVGTNIFSPKGDYTHEQSIVTIVRLYYYVILLAVALQQTIIVGIAAFAMLRVLRPSMRL